MATSPVAPGDARLNRTYSRRQALGRLSVAAGAGAAAWVVPEILTAKPAAGATLSGGNGGGTSPGGTSPGGTSPGGGTTGNPSTSPSTTSFAGSGTPATLAATTAPATSPGSALAMTGVDIERDAELGAALIAGGWAMHRWASRRPKLATDAVTEVQDAGSQADPT